MQLVMVLLCGVALAGAAVELKAALDNPQHSGAAYTMAAILLVMASVAGAVAALYIQRM